MVLLSKSGKITTFRHYSGEILIFLIKDVNKHTIFSYNSLKHWHVNCDLYIDLRYAT